jgi:hypothetical protein
MIKKRRRARINLRVFIVDPFVRPMRLIPTREKIHNANPN